MKKLLLPAIILFVTVILPIDIFASSLEVSKSSNFSSGDLNFGAGEAVYVRVKTDKVGSSSVLSVRDNNYSSIKTINLNRNGDTYSASFSAPSDEGYYSLEAKIEGEGVSLTSVKTIKVGNPGSANINVNVSSSVKGTKSVTKSENVEVNNDKENTQDLKVEESVLGESDPEVFSADKEVEEVESKGFFGMIFGFFEGAWNFFKIF